MHLQECELFLKSLLAHTDITAPPENLQEAIEANLASFHRQTMGQVVGMFTKGTLVQAAAISIPSTPPDDSQALVRFKYQFELSSAQYDTMRSELKGLVDLRNELAHHFLQRFNIQKSEGRTAASNYLDECSQIIDAHRSTLLGFTNALDLSRAQLASFVGSQEFEDKILQGGLPD